MNRISVLAALSFLVVFPPRSIESLTLEANTAVRLALENNLDLKSTWIDLQTSARNRKNVWNEYLPTVSAAASLIRSNEVPTTATGTLSPWNLNFTAQASLTLSSATMYSIRSVILDYESELLGYEAAKKLLEKNVRKAFYSLILEQESINLAEMELATAVHNYEQTVKNYKAGLVPRLQVLSAQVAAENQRPALESKKISYTSALMSFKMLLGLESEDEIILEGSIDTDVQHFDGRELAARFVNARLDIQELTKSIEALENARKVQALSELSPSLTLSASYSPVRADLFGSNLGEADAWSDGGRIALSISMPLSGFVPGSASQTALAEIDDSIEKAKLSLDQALREAKNEIETLALQLEQSLRSIEALQLNVSLAQEAYDLTEKAYRAGTEQLLEVQSAFDDLQEARLSILHEKYNYLSGLLDLEYALNTSLK